tara:strand:- start:1840 stop:2925 length:1086 start_codon:yes stop_codon:yes gene_type:complete
MRINFYKNWKRAIIDSNISLKKAIQNLNKTALQICFVYKNDKFYGTLTDGDIRRGLIKGIELNDKIDLIVNTKPNIILQKDLDKKIIVNRVFKKFNSNLIPIINSKKIITDIFRNETLFQNVKKLDYEMIIIAGGKGKRLMPLTKNTPKALIKVSGKPILENIILKAKKEGIKNFSLVTFHMHNKIYKYFKDGKKLGVNIKYIREKSPLGTAGGITLLNSQKNRILIVTNCDIITNLNYMDVVNFHKTNKNKVTIASKFYILSNPYGVIKLGNSNSVLRIDEKPSESNLISAGVYVINSRILSYFKKGQKIDMTDFINYLVKKNIKVGTCPIHENWTDIGSLTDLKKYRTEYNMKGLNNNN